MKRRAAILIPSFNAETSMGRLRMKSMHLFAGERPEIIREICADANPAVEGTVDIPNKESLECHPRATDNPRKVSSDESSADTTCLSSSLITQLASIRIKGEQKSSTNPTTSTKHGSLPFTFSKSLQTRIKMAKRPNAPPTCHTSKKRVHSRRRNRIVILNSKIMTTTQRGRKSIDPILHFESNRFDSPGNNEIGFPHTIP